MNKKIVGVFIVMLLILTVIPIVRSANENYQDQIFDKITSVDNNRYFKDDKNNYKFPVMNDIFEPLDSTMASPKPEILEDLPDYFNWMEYEGEDWTTPVKNQSDCGCCWDFAAIGALESIINIRENNPELDLDLSEQYVISCLPGSGSCRGGWSYYAYNYLKENLIDGAFYNGALPESCFPYVGIDIYGNAAYESGFDPVLCGEKCDNWNKQLVPIKDCGYWIPDGTDEDIAVIKTQIMQYGPVCAYHYVTTRLFNWGYDNHNSTDYFPYYRADGINHVVVIVGWKDDPEINKGGYWIIKNSWDTDWGYNGFFNLEYNSLNIDSFQIDWVDYDANSSNWNPYKPNIDGPDNADIEEECTFSTFTEDPINRHIEYRFDWGDDSYSDWLGPFESGKIITSSHSWNETGLYNVRVKAKNNDNAESQWSNSIIICIPEKTTDGTDQKQPRFDGGYRCWSGMRLAQSFIPLENTLTMVSLFMQKVGDPHNIKISIREKLDQMDLTFIEFDADSISDKFRWQEFDFPDINIIPGNTYYIVWSPVAFDKDNTFKWGFSKDNQYTDGCAWSGHCVKWEELDISEYPEPDFCFKTYYAKTKSMPIINTLFLQRLIHRFPFFEKILNQII